MQAAIISQELPAALSVSQINERAKRSLESNFSGIFVEGEVSKMSSAASYRHWYFTIKDESSSLNCAYFNPPSNIAQPKVGDKIILRGKISLYTKDARFQFIADKLYATDIEGAMHAEYLRLYEKLKSQGIFERKRPLPASFKSVGIITSASSAAMADILRIRSELGDFYTKVSIYDSLVQGPSAPMALLNALKRADAANHDVILIARGGGSKEDLFCFNNEELSIAISHAKSLIITALGHEIDQHLADFAADLSLPTPSAAARRIFFDANERIQQIDYFKERINTAINSNLAQRQQKLKMHSLRLLKNPFKEYLSKLLTYHSALFKAISNNLKTKQNALNIDLHSQVMRKINERKLQLESKQPSRKQIDLRLNLEHSKLVKISEQKELLKAKYLDQKTAKLERAAAIINANKGFLNTIKSHFLISSANSDNCLNDLSKLPAGSEISITPALKTHPARTAVLK